MLLTRAFAGHDGNPASLETYLADEVKQSECIAFGTLAVVVVLHHPSGGGHAPVPAPALVNGEVPLEDEVAAVLDLGDRIEARQVDLLALFLGEIRHSLKVDVERKPSAIGAFVWAQSADGFGRRSLVGDGTGRRST